ncbi:MAG: ACT domain-containing protein [Xanthomonadales bacterium]|nr:ACT domain-containing protein [Gammaproteobacteria bacterium]MBT8052286.1 ACT domain-containing protein [Gammaproteobacteria bacterium]NNJ79360.1 ACT domain-containing protein [Xanthomonadales bacterium]NNK51510.1 ACT domain-containing protein [Xanthomonadales bacterium]
MNTSIVLTVVSDDHPGVVEALSEVIADNGGNWTESSMLSLAGKFAGILLVQLPEENVESFFAELKALDSRGMQIVAQLSDSPPVFDSAREYSFELVGQDRPGIVHEITEVLADFGINVQELETTVQSASMSGESLFMAHARIFIPPGTDRDSLQEKLEDLANELMVDIELEA